MIARRASSAATILAMVVCLNGCVAAAIPVIAGAGMVRAGTDGEGAEEAPPATAASSPAPVQSTPSPQKPAPVQTGTRNAQTSAEQAFELALNPDAPLPAPAAKPVPTATPYDGLFDYVVKVATDRASGKPSLSAMLINPASLDAKRKQCAAKEPLVLIDLDPHGGSLAAEDAVKVAPSVTAGLQKIRAAGVTIAWVSQGTAGDAGAIRVGLTQTGLDPEGEDRLVLMRYPGDRKQTRRVEIANENCILAIAGDHREDFDELYEHLLKPEAAQPLEALIGEGWFLVPPPLGKAE